MPMREDEEEEEEEEEDEEEDEEDEEEETVVDDEVARRAGGGGGGAGRWRPARVRVAARDGAMAVLAGKATYAPRPWDVLAADDADAAAVAAGPAVVEDAAAFCGALEYAIFH